MVICKFYRQGICRFGQYCQFEHVNHFGSQTNNTKVDFYSEDEIAVLVAKEVLLAERGGQWLLSCFAPIKERPSIPGMEDLSPEEVRWEIYQAQKSGMVEQAKLHFQQLCQDMKAKRDALKNPNRETAMMLKKLLGSGQKGGLNGSSNATGKSSSFSFAAPQLALANNTSANNVFGKQSFSVQNNNPFSGGFTSSNNTSLFGSNNNGTPMFGGTPTFVNNLGFGATTNTSSIFGGTTNTSTFNNVQNTSAFGVTPQTNSIFGGSSQNIFGQSNVFGGTNQLTTQSSTSFDNNATSSSSLFNVPITSQANTPLFGGTQTTTTNLFGNSSNAQTNSGFGVTTSSGPFSNGIFSQSKALPAFGGAPVFGGVTNYSNNAGTIFGSSAQTFGTNGISTNIFASAAATPAFGASTASTTPTFGAVITTTNPTFGTPVATTTPTFGVPVVTTTPAFGLGQQSTTNTFGATVSTSNAFGSQNTGATLTVSNTTPFGEPTVAINSPFVTAASSQFGSTSTTSTPFVAPRFGVTGVNTNDTFGTAATSSNSLFANTRTTFAPLSATGPNPSPFSTQTFGNLSNSPFGVPCTTITTITSTTTTTTTTTRTNPFAPRVQQNGNTSFGNAVQNHLTSVIGTSPPFGKAPLLVTVTNSIIDDSIYAAEGSLTDDEKKMFLADKFVIGKIPLKPPTKDIK